MKIPIYQPWITDLEKEYVQDAINSGWVSCHGKYIELFEKGFAKYLNIKYALLTSSGTTACHLALLSIGIKPNDNVLIPAITFVATANAVKYCQGNVICQDIQSDTWNLNPQLNIRNINYLFPVHLFGNPCDITALKKCYPNVPIIEDACEGIGAYHNGQHVGTLGDVGVFSLFGNKTITAGEGGVLVTNNKKIYEKALLLRNHSHTGYYYHSEIGYNYCITNLQAALVYAQLCRIKEILKQKRRVYETYVNELENCPNIILQQCIPNSQHGYWMFVVKTNNVKYIREILEQHDIETRSMFYPVNKLPMYRNNKQYENANVLHSQGLMLPSYPQLSNNNIKKICQLIKQETQ